MPRPPSHPLKKCLRLPKREPTLRDVRIPTLSIREARLSQPPTVTGSARRRRAEFHCASMRMADDPNVQR
ncbi:hypothetical protein NUW54_g11831 [Trametes sanguinea]|uniref:Uncharacterized protein n=1 Tax=Trametes sanguinea TaxID=158606 RepID=A0ACC1N6Y7_9APHY|nr:hypothetical protein NUW54_g11831 [Trametes sanguinea]